MHGGKRTAEVDDLGHEFRQLYGLVQRDPAVILNQLQEELGAVHHVHPYGFPPAQCLEGRQHLRAEFILTAAQDHLTNLDDLIQDRLGGVQQQRDRVRQMDTLSDLLRRFQMGVQPFQALPGSLALLYHRGKGRRGRERPQ